ncbi:hypothetical protein C8J56DRAFT_1100277 [Mycena floridula]|nr:hypothetical protein C8J56DRAFT_1100277 [Mycena floridula]
MVLDRSPPFTVFRQTWPIVLDLVKSLPILSKITAENLQNPPDALSVGFYCLRALGAGVRHWMQSEQHLRFCSKILDEWMSIWPWIHLFILQIVDVSAVLAPESESDAFQRDCRIVIGEILSDIGILVQELRREQALLSTPGIIPTVTLRWIADIRRFCQLICAFGAIVDNPSGEYLADMKSTMLRCPDFMSVLLLDELTCIVERKEIELTYLYTTLELLHSLASEDPDIHHKLLEHGSIRAVTYVLSRLVRPSAEFEPMARSGHTEQRLRLSIEMAALYLTASFNSTRFYGDDFLASDEPDYNSDSDDFMLEFDDIDPDGDVHWMLHLLDPDHRFLDSILRETHIIYCSCPPCTALERDDLVNQECLEALGMFITWTERHIRVEQIDKCVRRALERIDALGPDEKRVRVPMSIVHYGSPGKLCDNWSNAPFCRTRNIHLRYDRYVQDHSVPPTKMSSCQKLRHAADVKSGSTVLKDVKSNIGVKHIVKHVEILTQTNAKNAKSSIPKKMSLFVMKALETWFKKKRQKYEKRNKSKKTASSLSSTTLRSRGTRAFLLPKILSSLESEGKCCQSRHRSMSDMKDRDIGLHNSLAKLLSDEWFRGRLRIYMHSSKLASEQGRVSRRDIIVWCKWLSHHHFRTVAKSGQKFSKSRLTGKVVFRGLEKKVTWINIGPMLILWNKNSTYMLLGSLLILIHGKEGYKGSKSKA